MQYAKKIPDFVAKQEKNKIWLNMIGSNEKRIDITVAKILKGESKSLKAVYGYLRFMDSQSNNGFSYPSRDTIARKARPKGKDGKRIMTGIATKTVTRCIKRLVEIGLIFVKNPEGHNVYFFTLPPSWKEHQVPLKAAITKAKKTLEAEGLISLKKEKEKARFIDKYQAKESLQAMQKNRMSPQNVPPECPPNIYQNKKRIEAAALQTEVQENRIVTIPFSVPKAIKDVFIADFVKRGVKYELQKKHKEKI